MAAPKIHFEADLDYQQEAIASAVDLFEGLPLSSGWFSISNTTAAQLNVGELGIGNPNPGDSFELALLENLRRVQERHDLPTSDVLDGTNFTVEMETGTGKTYVYLRTLFELNKRYGFTKFVIVVPSVAIREGVLSSIKLMRQHFWSLYSTPFDAEVYGSNQLGKVRQFATANMMQILIMNIDAFRKDLDADGKQGTAKANVINRANDRMSGRKPIEFIQACRPVVVIDEPQNMESEKSVAAIERLGPLCTLRYSATHKKSYNPIYRLGPVEAHQKRLVKSIEIASVVEDDNLNATFIELKKVDQKKQRAQVRINVGSGSSAKQKSVWVKLGDDLRVLSDQRQEYAHGLIVTDISFRPGDENIEFANGECIDIGVSKEGFGDDIKRAQIRATIEQHLDKERSLARNDNKVKVLSLIFLDKVANYRTYADNGDHQPGRFAEWFEQAYTEIVQKPKFASMGLPSAADVHDGYFSKDKKGRIKNSSERGSKDDATTYDLIMKDKQRLLDTDEPLRFIFSHSALREGWDNPNIFQICTLNESKSKDRKRQEIGRGLRLPVNDAGERVRDANMNRLTVIANEAYEDFARSLQNEYEEDTGRRFGLVEKDAFTRLQRPDSHPTKPGDKFGRDGSAIVWEHLVEEKILNQEGEVLPRFQPNDEFFSLPVPAEYEPVRDAITRLIEARIDPIKIRNTRDRIKIHFSKQVTLDPDFRALWNKISKKTRYRVELDTSQLVADTVKDLKAANPIEAPKVTIRVAQVGHKLSGLTAEEIRTKKEVETKRQSFLPDILADLQNETDLTRKTLIRILTESGRLDDFAVNPQAFLKLVSGTINTNLQSQVLTGITYTEIAGTQWEMRKLEPEANAELERYASNLYKVQNKHKTPYDHVECDAGGEHQFARQLDVNNDIKFYIKLPNWFKVDTPIGSYNPDWAIMMEAESKLYLVRETKGSLNPRELRETEKLKIDCAEKHFEAINVDYKVCKSLEELV